MESCPWDAAFATFVDMDSAVPVNAEGSTVFPKNRVPYASQLQVVSGVREAIAKRKNCIISSPTGTGKTIALLSAVVSEMLVNPTLRVLYASRTHTQLDQAIREARNIPEIGELRNINTVRLAGKDRLCLRRGKKCAGCRHQKDVAEVVNLDIEEIASKHGNAVCAYKATFSAFEHCRIAFVPYNYIFDPHLKKYVLDNQVLIVDEAHNIKNIILSCNSAEVTAFELEAFIRDYVEDFSSKCTLQHLCRNLQKCTSEDRYITFREFKDQYFISGNCNKLREFLDIEVEEKHVNVYRFVSCFYEVWHRKLYTPKGGYGVIVGNRRCKFDCYDVNATYTPAIMTHNCTILASGTMPETSYVEKELGEVSFPLRIDATYDKAPRVKILQMGRYNNVLLSSTMKNATPEYSASISEIVKEIVKIVPHGILVFSPSKRSTKLLDTYHSTKKTFFEEDGIDNFKEESTNGAVLYATFRGKSCEGVDFSDDHARAVILVGIPIAPPNLLNQFDVDDAIIQLNQAAGRCIRHQNDWGLVYFLDHRAPDYTDKLSNLTKNMQCVRDLPELLEETRQFLATVRNL